VFRRLYHARALAVLACAFLCLETVAQINSVPVNPPIRNVMFERVTGLTSADEQGITQTLQQEDPAWIGKQRLDGLSRFIRNTVLSAYQDRGYWKANLSVEVTWVRGSGASRQVDVLVSATDEGAQYALKEIHLTGASVFPNDQLLGLMPIHPSELMSRSKVEQGLEAMRSLYAARGYIAFAAIPHAELDDAAHTVVLDLALQEDRPFRFGNLSVEGADQTASRQLRQAWEEVRQQLYSQDKLRSLVRDSLRLPPGTDPLDCTTSNLDFDTHTVDVQVSLPPQTQAEKTAR